MEQRRLDEHSRLIFRETWAQVDLDIEDTAVQVSHGPTKVCQLPKKGIVVNHIEIHDKVLVLFVFFNYLFMLALQVRSDAGFLFLGGFPLYSPIIGLNDDGIFDLVEPTSQFRVVKVSIH